MFLFTVMKVACHKPEKSGVVGEFPMSGESEGNFDESGEFLCK